MPWYGSKACKKKYLKLIPYAWEMINQRFKEQNEFNNLMLLLKNNFPKFINSEYNNLQKMFENGWNKI